MSVDELLASNPGIYFIHILITNSVYTHTSCVGIRDRLGSVKTILAANCEELDRKIGKFVDSEREEVGWAAFTHIILFLPISPQRIAEMWKERASQVMQAMHPCGHWLVKFGSFASRPFSRLA